jgi:hypothetical protein
MPISSPLGKKTNEELSGQNLSPHQAAVKAQVTERLASGNHWGNRAWRGNPNPQPHQGKAEEGGL